MDHNAAEPKLIAEARVETELASRYIVQLCRHVDKIGKRNPEMRADVEWSDQRGEISFGWGKCLLRAEPGSLVLHAEASDEEGLRRLQDRVAHRLEAFGRREQVTVTWTLVPPGGEEDTHG